MNAPQLEFAFHLEVDLGPIREMGAWRAGHRWIIPIFIETGQRKEHSVEVALYAVT
jgi:hypothetical protein